MTLDSSTDLAAPQLSVGCLVLDHRQSLSISRTEDYILVLVALLGSTQDQRVPSRNGGPVHKRLSTVCFLADDQILVLDGIHAILLNGQRLNLLDHVVDFLLLVVHVPGHLRIELK